MDNHVVGLEYASADDRGGAEVLTFDPNTGDQLDIQKRVIPALKMFEEG